MRFRPADPMLLASRLAGRCASELARADEAAALETLSRVFDGELTPDLEYIVLMGPDGFTHVHTNAMRAGRVYGDPVSLAAAAVRVAKTQRYERNTGEVIREAIVPVSRHGAHHSVLRVGQIVPKGSVRRRVTGSLLVAAAIPSATVLASAGAGAAAEALVAGTAGALALAVWNHRRISGPVRIFNETARAVSSGDLTAVVTGAGRDELGQMGFELNKVVLGLQKVIEAGGASSAAVNELASRMAAATGETATAMAEIATSAHQTHDGAGRQAERAAEAAAAAARVGEGLAECGARAASAQDVLRGAHDTAEAGVASLDRATAAMAGVTEAVGEGRARVEALDRRGQAIEEVVTTISSIAAQTNLLALNAAIEGARAGEHGRGFVVVATEVGKLAEQAAAAAHSIGELVAEVQAETARAVAAMGTGADEVATAVSAVDGVRVAVGDLTRDLGQVAAVAGDVESATAALGQDAALLADATVRSAEDAGEALRAAEFISADHPRDGGRLGRHRLRGHRAVVALAGAPRAGQPLPRRLCRVRQRSPGSDSLQIIADTASSPRPIASAIGLDCVLVPRDFRGQNAANVT